MIPRVTVSAPPGVAGGSAWPLGPRDVIAPGRSVVRRLAGGGGHEVFLVTAGDPHGFAVAKLPRPHLVEDPHCLLRLRGEGRALEWLAHPALPRHLDTVLNGHYPHLLLEHVPGPTLRDAIAARSLLTPRLIASLGSARSPVRSLTSRPPAGYTST